MLRRPLEVTWDRCAHPASPKQARVPGRRASLTHTLLQGNQESAGAGLVLGSTSRLRQSGTGALFPPPPTPVGTRNPTISKAFL